MTFWRPIRRPGDGSRVSRRDSACSAQAGGRGMHLGCRCIRMHAGHPRRAAKFPFALAGKAQRWYRFLPSGLDLGVPQGHVGCPGFGARGAG